MPSRPPPLTKPGVCRSNDLRFDDHLKCAAVCVRPLFRCSQAVYAGVDLPWTFPGGEEASSTPPVQPGQLVVVRKQDLAPNAGASGAGANAGAASVLGARGATVRTLIALTNKTDVRLGHGLCGLQCPEYLNPLCFPCEGGSFLFLNAERWGDMLKNNL